MSRSTLAAACAAVLLAGCGTDPVTPPAARLDGAWYGEFPVAALSLSLRRDADDRVSGEGWLTRRVDGRFPAGVVEALTAAGTIDPATGTVQMELSSRTERSVFSAFVPRPQYRVDAVVRDGELRIEALSPFVPEVFPIQTGRLTREAQSRGAGVLSVRVVEADPATLSGVYTGSAGAAAFAGGGEPGFQIVHAFGGANPIATFAFTGARPAVGRYALARHGAGTRPAPGVASARLLVTASGGRLSTFAQEFVPDEARPAANALQVTESTPYRVRGTYRFDGYLVRDGVRQPDRLVATGEFDAPCTGGCP